VSTDGTGPDAAAHRDEAPQFALPLVVRVERADPPERTDALEAAARAVLVFLTDPRTVDGEWTEAFRAWEDGRIRKVVRRARGAGWDRATALPGVTVTDGTAQLRVFPPVPVDDWPPDLAKLQVSGTELADTEPPAAPGPGLPMLWLNPALEMTAGKAMAQAGHAAQLTWWRLPEAARTAWHADDFALAVRTAPPARWANLVASDLPVVRDAGYTEVEPGACTVVADHPALRLLQRLPGNELGFAVGHPRPHGQDVATRVDRFGSRGPEMTTAQHEVTAWRGAGAGR
jgi:peptidyl-tRNA hydrolase